MHKRVFSTVNYGRAGSVKSCLSHMVEVMGMWVPRGVYIRAHGCGYLEESTRR